MTSSKQSCWTVVRKRNAPEPLVPKRQFKNKDEIVEPFLKERNKHIGYIETDKDDLRNHIFLIRVLVCWIPTNG